jgi:NADH-quinone oxidoreductase subunit I
MQLKDKKLNILEYFYIPPILKAMGTTLRHFFSRKVTIEYPTVRKEIYPRFRGAHRLEKDEKGREKCVACELCATVCPSKAITIEAAESPDPDKEKYPLRYEIDILRCIFCGFCVEACPKEAITMTDRYELADYSRENLIYDKEMLLK